MPFPRVVNQLYIYHATENLRVSGPTLLQNVRMPNDALIVAQQAYQMSGHKYAILPFAIAQIYVSLVSELEICHSSPQQFFNILIIHVPGKLR